MENKEQFKSLIETAKLHGWKDPNKLNETEEVSGEFGSTQYTNVNLIFANEVISTPTIDTLTKQPKYY